VLIVGKTQIKFPPKVHGRDKKLKMQFGLCVGAASHQIVASAALGCSFIGLCHPFAGYVDMSSRPIPKLEPKLEPQPPAFLW